MATINHFDCMNPIDVPATAFTLAGFSDWARSDDFPEKQKVAFIQGSLFIETVGHPDELIGIHVPPAAKTLEGFSDWTYSEGFPERGRITFVNGRLIVDMSPERYETHNKIKTEIDYAIVDLVKKGDLGEFYSDGARFKNDAAGISNEPDAMLALWATLESGKLAPPKSRPQDGKHIDLFGTPDWICEIVSDSSVGKDTEILFEAYHKAGIREYWLVDARGEEIDFQLLVWTPEGYRQAEVHEGWQKSPVFDCQFQLTRSRDRLNRWRYQLSKQ
ncbi:MAG: Uma2 family endonuclease [Planctomycetes bacterium]|nr:Uma2 family endonuclease [Planctomycetota bacterium]